MKTAMRVAVDLDQTLVRGGDAAWRNWLDAIEVALGVSVPLEQDWASYPVHTDHGLFAEVARRFRGRAHTAGEWEVFEQGWLARLEAILHLYTPIPGARELLATLPQVAIATGNVHSATVRKLAHAGFVSVPCACSDDAPDRVSLVATALSHVGWRPGLPAVSLGDGVWDVKAARALGVGFVGVALTEAHEARLRAAGARHVLRDYLDREAVLAAISGALPPDPA